MSDRPFNCNSLDNSFSKIKLEKKTNVKKIMGLLKRKALKKTKNKIDAERILFFNICIYIEPNFLSVF